MSLHEFYKSHNVELAPDGIPLRAYDLEKEYDTALNGAIVLDRSHEARIKLTGKSRFELLNRMSTNDTVNLKTGQGAPTIFTTPNARIIDRVMVVNDTDDSLLLLGGPGRGQAIHDYLKRNIFFNDDVQLADFMQETVQFALHGPQADAILAHFGEDMADMPLFSSKHLLIADVEVMVIRVKPFVDTHFAIIVPEAGAVDVLRRLIDAGAMLAGSLTYNTLRIRAGVPGTGRELSQEYIPLEVGLWDEISFNKGCYTGQEIIARMESRNKLARTIVRLQLDSYINAPTELTRDGKPAGRLTSSVQAPDGEIFAMGIVKTALAEAGMTLTCRDSDVNADVVELLGVQSLERA